MRSQDADRLVGRQSLLAELDHVLDAAASGTGALVFLTGEPGIGKTRLAQECTRRARRLGFVTAWSACWGDGNAPGFWPWTQLIRAVLDAEPSLDDALGPARQLTDVGAPAPGADPELARFTLFDAVASFVRTAATPDPLLLVIDDFHWADVPSLSLLAFITQQLASFGVLVVATCRDGEAPDMEVRRRLDELLAHGDRIELTGLGEAELGPLVSGVTGTPPTRDALHELSRRTGGNPLFASEIARLAHIQQVPLAAVALPDSIRTLLMRRIEPLAADARLLLNTAAVIGARFRTDVLARTTELAPSDVLEALDEVTSRQLIRGTEPGWHEFTHVLIRDAIYDDLGLARRVRHHELVAGQPRGAALGSHRNGDPSGDDASVRDRGGLSQRGGVGREDR